MVFLYDFALFLYLQLIRLMAFFNPKASLWLEGRKDVFKNLEEKLDPQKHSLWMHCSSLGEFEQGRPVLENFRSTYPEYQIVLTFFSPSAYEIRKEYPHADHIYYLPLDSKKNASRWISLIKPKAAIFVKYDFWYHYLHELKKVNCPTLLVSANFRGDQIFFRSYGGFFRRMLLCFDHIFVQKKNDEILLQQIGLQKTTLAGDTRIDRVMEIAAASKKFSLIRQFGDGHPVLILGSSWSPEEDILVNFLKNNKSSDWKYIIAPHDIRETHLSAIEKKMPIRLLRYSQLTEENAKSCPALLIDNIGMLSALYKYGRVAFIGGGFGAGIHNILEPIAFGLPVIFGPKYKKFVEARHLITNGGAFCIKKERDFQKVFEELMASEAYGKASASAENFITQNKGATNKVMFYLKKVLSPDGAPMRLENET